MKINCLNYSKPARSGRDQLDFYRQRLLKTVYTMVSRAIFKPDKIPAAAHIAREMNPDMFHSNVCLDYSEEISILLN